MTEAFDAATVPLAGIWPGAATLVLLAACLIWRLTRRKQHWVIPGFIAVFGVLAAGIPSWDQLRLRRMLAEGTGPGDTPLQVTHGTIAQTWHIVDRRRDHSKTSISYKTVVSEGFDVGGQRFSWTIGGCLSPASLCDLARSRVPLKQGQEIEVTWFADPAQQDEPRILRLAVRTQR